MTMEKNIQRGYTTRSSHLRRLKRGEDEAWNEFYRKYRSMILAIGRKRHLEGGELDDLMQEVAAVCHKRLQEFVYEPERCRFRTFLFQVTRNLANNLRRRNREKLPAARLPESATPAIPPEVDEEFLREYEEFIFKKALQMLKDSVDSETYAAFELAVLEHRPIAEVAAITGKTANNLYSIRHRCLKKLRENITLLQNELAARRETDVPSPPNTASR